MHNVLYFARIFLIDELKMETYNFKLISVHRIPLLLADRDDNQDDVSGDEEDYDEADQEEIGEEDDEDDEEDDEEDDDDVIISFLQ